MVYYGEWQQLDDYERPGIQLAWDGGVVTGGAGAEFWDDPQTPRMPLTGDDAFDMNRRLDEAKGVSTLLSGPDENYPIVAEGYLPALARPENGYKVANGAVRIGPQEGATAPPTWMVPPWFEWPEGATGYEFAAEAGTIVAAMLEFGDVAPTGSENDDSDPDADGQLVAVGYWDLALRIRSDQGAVPRDYEGTTLAAWNYPTKTGPVSGYFDVGWAALENDGRFILLGQASATVTSFDRDHRGWWGCSLDIMVQDSVAGGGSPGNGLVAVHYTIRPPLFRWVYEKPPTTSLAPLRQFPRDDNLATSSAARVWSSSQQGSLRRRGYF